MKYIAFLRGINVGGKNIIRMPELKQAFINIGMHDVFTYIQSGNVIFSSDDTEDILVKKIKDSIFEAFGFNIPIILRTLAELENLLKRNPFSEKEIQHMEQKAESEIFYLFLFSNNLSEDDIEYIYTAKHEKERLEVIERNVYVLFHQTIRNSKLAAALQKIETHHCTSRNMKTINKLIELGRNNFI